MFKNANNNNGCPDIVKKGVGLKGKTEFFYRRGDGSSLYATRDIAYHIWKFKQCDNLINILGEDENYDEMVKFLSMFKKPTCSNFHVLTSALSVEIIPKKINRMTKVYFMTWCF